ncbi:acyl-CoA carboxylase subunit epsilon [Yinghuangia sp. ASG 101]|uniref:acyl-CoA carboxylase subunit epsilon n=1 Tax=Yinghuangia sp. ASG 101 TaxID=2896848 RepID=UPI001E63C3D0|nr:acyl-CoA carboxylase subunit epsilon [Yinghuangia sp. ASG 101]UGQ14436.1 acyl-CoA carboxylase subunit epsilon [Yinghuangia sp. ASG 101]
MIKIVRGEPTPEELAAIVTVIAARSSAGAPAEAPAPSQWNAPARLVRTPLRPGPGAWQASGWAR